MPVDLTRARATYQEKVMLDRGTLTRNPEGWRETPLDEQTGRYVTTANGIPDDLIVVAEDIPCKVKAQRVGLVSSHLGGAEESGLLTGQFEVVLAWDDAIVPAVGDILTLTTATDPRLADASFILNEIVDATIRVSRRAIGTRRVDVRDRS